MGAGSEAVPTLGDMALGSSALFWYTLGPIAESRFPEKTSRNSTVRTGKHAE